MHPTRLKNKETTNLTIKNAGNRPKTYRVRGQEAADELKFTFSPGDTVEIAPGASRTVGITVAAALRHWLGNQKQLSFKLLAEDPNNILKPKEYQGTMVVDPIIPRWLVRIFPFLMILVFGASGFSIYFFREQARILDQRLSANATATQQEIIYAAGTSTSQVQLQQTADQLAILEETRNFQATGTAQAQLDVTATAISDVDGDGLTYQEEQDAGTDPSKSDTDEDGLTDWQELKQYRTDPTNIDTDDDLLNDGAEIEKGTLPNNPDTDGDGVLDGLEVRDGTDPRSTPVAVLPPTPVPPPPTATPVPEPPENELDIEWQLVSAGPFMMGAAEGDGFAENTELPLHSVGYLDEFWIAKTEITNDQFQKFIDEQGGAIEFPSPDCTVSEPSEDAEMEGDHPVVCVTQFEAQLFAQWLSAKIGASVSLPTEAEWEKAARGNQDVRIYPWGNEFNGFLVNFCDALCEEPGVQGEISDGAKQTEAVNVKPNNASPYGAVDMSGNVLEWTRSIWGSERATPQFAYPYDPNDGRESNKMDDENGERVFYVIRGGGWNTAQNNVRVSSRERLEQKGRHSAVGFRLVMRLNGS
ncbi:MAG: SUMF1/EgtB/PvdO family nonheme iron enzyme, partial [Chloroflexota bacterium]